MAKIPLCVLVLAYPTIKEKIWGPDVVEDKTFAALERFWKHAHDHMVMIVNIKRRREEHWEAIISENQSGFLIVATMDAWVKWRAGAIKGHINR